MENSKIRCTHTPEHERKHKQDCECVKCIDIEINQFNPRKTSRRLPRLSRISRPINNRQKEKDEKIKNKNNEKKNKEQIKKTQNKKIKEQTKKLKQKKKNKKLKKK